MQLRMRKESYVHILSARGRKQEWKTEVEMCEIANLYWIILESSQILWVHRGSLSATVPRGSFEKQIINNGIAHKGEVNSILILAEA